MMVWSRHGPSLVELRRCTLEHSTTGEYIEDDPQGEGAAVHIGASTTLVVTESLFTRNVCGKKVCMFAGSGRPADVDSNCAGNYVILRSTSYVKYVDQPSCVQGKRCRGSQQPSLGVVISKPPIPFTLRLTLKCF